MQSLSQLECEPDFRITAEWLNKMRLKLIGISFLLVLGGVIVAFAAPASFHQDGRATIRAYQVQEASVDKQGQRNMQAPMPQQNDPRRREFSAGDTSGSSQAGESTSSFDNGRKQGQGRMSPEERRALRRQIDEAGHDIYTPKR
jgi:hypothetical protein